MAADIRLATRESRLAMWQANDVRERLLRAWPDITVEIIPMTTQGDRDKVTPLANMGGKGVFVKELEVAMMEGRADIAVHSMKDVPGELPAGFHIAAICEREDPRDAMVATAFESLAAMPAGSRIGSSSLRRRLQLKDAYPDLEFIELRGNVPTRLQRLDDGDFDGIILAAAGLKRLGLEVRITERIDVETSIPAAGQGAVGVECRQDDERVNELVRAIGDPVATTCVGLEREITLALGATCNLPIGAHVVPDENELVLSAFVSNLTGETQLRRRQNCPPADGRKAAAALGQSLLDAGARELLAGT